MGADVAVGTSLRSDPIDMAPIDGPTTPTPAPQSQAQAPASPGASATKRKAPAAAVDTVADEAMEQQLRAHAIRVCNDFFHFFRRRANELIAANRAVSAHQVRAAQAARKTYPMGATPMQLKAMMNLGCSITHEAPIAPAANVRKLGKSSIHTASDVVCQTRTCVILPHVPAKPCATMWTALSKNYEVEDEPTLKFLPYFGDDDDDDVVSEFYQVKQQCTSTAEIEFTKEMCEAVLRQLQTTWELTPPDLKQIATAIQVEEQVVVEMYKQMIENQRLARKRKRDAAASAARKTEAEASAAAAATDGTKNDDDDEERDDKPLSMEDHFQKYETLVDSFRTLYCRRCYTYDCDYHGCQEPPKLEITEQNAVALKIKHSADIAGTGQNCGNQCFLGQMGVQKRFSKQSAITAAFGWDAKTRTLCARAYFVCSGNFCEMAKLLGDKTCLEVAEFCEHYEINNSMLTEKTKIQPRRRGGRKKKKLRPSFAHLQQIESGPVNRIPTAIVPCAHMGPCEEGTCSCIDEGHFCSKLCNCVHEECKIFFPGCRCVRGKCKTKACPCYAAGRECDLDLCSVCCADDVAELKGMPRKTPSAVPAGSSAAPIEIGSSTTAGQAPCHNRRVGAFQHKRVRLGRSTTEEAGWGLFVDEFVAKDDFVYEYTGEMVSQEEAERRGAVYDKLNRSYLFNLDNQTVVDATRKGNKTRFINHASKPNCYTKIINVNSDYRIGLYAARDIEPHTELFFDYGYEMDLRNDHLHKQPTVTEWMKQKQRGRGGGR